MKVEKDEFLNDDGKSAMMTMRRRPLADRSRLELRQPEILERLPRCQVRQLPDRYCFVCFIILFGAGSNWTSGRRHAAGHVAQQYSQLYSLV